MKGNINKSGATVFRFSRGPRGKLQHPRASQAENAREAAPVLEFGIQNGAAPPAGGCLGAIAIVRG